MRHLVPTPGRTCGIIGADEGEARLVDGRRARRSSGPCYCRSLSLIVPQNPSIHDARWCQTPRMTFVPKSSPICSIDSPRYIYAEVPLRHGDTAGQAPDRPDYDNKQSPHERVRKPDVGPVAAVAAGQDETSAAELLPRDVEPPGARDDGRASGSANPLIGSQVIREAVREEIQAYWSAPLPPPETLAQYDQIVPGMTERILVMTERSVTGKIDIDDKLANAEIETAKMGLSLAFALTSIAFLASVIFFAFGDRVAGVAFLSFPVLMLIRSFIPRTGRSEPGDN
jgi:uncharacterized membrane protein